MAFHWLSFASLSLASLLLGVEKASFLLQVSQEGGEAAAASCLGPFFPLGL